MSISIYTPFWEKADYNKNKPLLLYGFGHFGVYYFKRAIEAGIEIKAIFDMKPQYQNMMVAGVPILSPDKIKDFDCEMNVLISSVRDKYTLTNKFKKLGFNNLYYASFDVELMAIEAHIANKEVYAEKIKQNEAKILEARKLFTEPKSLEIFDSVFDAWGNGNWERLEACAERETVLPRDIFPENKHEVLVECGAYDGGGISAFINETKCNYDYIYAFEPGELEYFVALRMFEISRIDNAEIHCLAVSDVNGPIYFSGDNSIQGMYRVQDGDGGIMLPSTTLDTFFAQPGKKNPTLIRMDIEGSEVSALYGAKELIYNCMPNLSISAYHRLTDYWEVPLTIAELGKKPGYEFFLRHYFCWYDTMCYARPRA